MLKKVKVSQLLPNPHRNMSEYPINEDKVEELIGSFEKTGVWPNIIARKAGDKFEIAYGHHRLVAMQRKKIREVQIVVQSMSSAQMLLMMAAENSESWASNAAIDQETVRAVVNAVASGDLDLSGDIDKSAKHKLVAPSVLPHQELKSPPRGTIYTRQAVAKFLGWTKKNASKTGGFVPSQRFDVAWKCLEVVELGDATTADFRGLSREQARIYVEEAALRRKAWQKAQRDAEKKAEKERKAAEKAADAKQRAKHEREAARAEAAAAEAAKAGDEEVEAAKKLANEMRAGSSYREAKQEAKESRRQPPLPADKPKSLPNVEQICEKFSNAIHLLLNRRKVQEAAVFTKQRLGEHELLVLHWELLDERDPGARQNAIDQLRSLADRCNELADELE